jgi:hypothetical protein
VNLSWQAGYEEACTALGDALVKIRILERAVADRDAVIAALQTSGPEAVANDGHGKAETTAGESQVL